MIDITMTATRRPEILNRTLSSFRERLFGAKRDLRLIINIDPVGHEECTTDDVLRVCEMYFDRVVHRAPDKPSFPRAFHWAWSTAETETIFHLEEDWELLRTFDLDLMNYSVQTVPFAHLRLSQWKSEARLKNWKWFLEYDKENCAFMIPKDVTGTIGFCGHPSLNHRDFIKTCVEHMDPDRNPEKQIKWRNKALWEKVGHMNFGVFQHPHEPAAVRDTGRKWMIKHGWAKAGNKEHFITWEKK